MKKHKIVQTISWNGGEVVIEQREIGLPTEYYRVYWVTGQAAMEARLAGRNGLDRYLIEEISSSCPIARTTNNQKPVVKVFNNNLLGFVECIYGKYYLRTLYDENSQIYTHNLKFDKMEDAVAQLEILSKYKPPPD